MAVATKKKQRRTDPPRRNTTGWFDDGAAEQAVEFVETYCHHVEGELYGQRVVLAPWQAETTGELFGRKRKDGTRQYRKLYCEVPKKNGKSTWGAGLALKCLCADNEPGAKVYSAAADREQAAIVFGLATSMVQMDEDLDRRLRVLRQSILYDATRSIYRVLSADVKTKHGINAHAIIFDELHTQPTRLLYDTLKGAGAARRQPLMIMFTTAGYDRTSICWEVREYAKKKLEGLLEAPEMLAVIYGVDEAEDWTDEAVWAKANPNLGISVKLDFLRDECNEAKESPALQNTFRRLHLDQWTEQDVRWLDMKVWRENGAAPKMHKIDDEAECYTGLDLASTSDLAAKAKLFPNELDGFDVVMQYWCPRETAEKRTVRERLDYNLWIQQGLIDATEGDVIDYDAIHKSILEDREEHYIKEVGVDPWNSTQLQTQLTNDGLTVVPVYQNFSRLAAPTKWLDTLLRQRKIRHGNHRVTNWMASNVSVIVDANENMRPSKEKSSEKIDGIVAIIIALYCAMQHAHGSRYDEEGIETFG